MVLNEYSWVFQMNSLVKYVEPVSPPLDLVHLSRQTLGDLELEREILSLFVKQSVQLSQRMFNSSKINEQHDLAHTLIGSARAVGAWRVAKAAEHVDSVLNRGGVELSVALAELGEFIDEANSMIMGLN